MNSDPFYRQLVKVMQDSSRESMKTLLTPYIFLLATTRQSSRYKDDLQAARIVTANLIRQRPKRKFRTEMPTIYSESKVEGIFRVVHEWNVKRDIIRDSARRQRIEYLQQRVNLLRGEPGTEEVCSEEGL